MHDIALVYLEEIEKEYLTEMVKAEKVGEYYRIATIPFFAKHLAIGDLISVDTEDGVHYFDDIIEKSGNTTIRIIIKDKIKAQDLLTKVSERGAILYKLKTSDILVALDIPDKLNYESIKVLLDLGQTADIWEYEEACLGWK
jgi:hypothetical protein